MWTYNSELKLPTGVVLGDASEHCSKEDLGSITQNGKQGCLSAFSDLFRWSFLEKNDGWWFDTDWHACASSGLPIVGVSATTFGTVIIYQPSQDKL